MASASDSLNDGCNPTGNDRWRQLTFAGKGLDLASITTVADAPTSVIVEGARQDALSGERSIPNWTWSDWIPLRSLSRVDRIGAPRLLMLRTLVGRGSLWTGPNGGFGGFGLRHDVNRGFEYVSGAYPADVTTSAAQVRADLTGLGGQSQPVACVQFLTRNPGIVGMTAGDSHHQGTSTSTQFHSYLLQATISTGSRCIGRVPFGCVSCAQGGFTSQQMFGAFEALLPAVRPSYVVLPGWTWNEVHDGVHADQAAMDVFFARLLASAEQCSSMGAHPVFLTPFPRDAKNMGPVQKTPWDALRYAILRMREAGATVIDASDILGHRSDGELTGTYKPHFSTDQAHPNDEGHAAIAAELAQIIERRM